MRLVAKTALFSAAAFGVYAAVWLGSNWLDMRRWWKKHTEYDPQDRDNWGV